MGDSFDLVRLLKIISTRTTRDSFPGCGATIAHDPNQFVLGSKLQWFPACGKGTQRTEVVRDRVKLNSGGGPETGGGSKGSDQRPKRIDPVQEVMMQGRVTAERRKKT